MSMKKVKRYLNKIFNNQGYKYNYLSYKRVIKLTIKHKDINIIVNYINGWNYNKKIYMKYIEELAIKNNIVFEKNIYIFHMEYWYLVNNEYIISFVGHMSKDKMVTVKNITIYDKTDSVIAHKEMKEY